MTLDQARMIRMPFGKHKKIPLGEIEQTDLRYLDFLNGCDLRGALLEAVALLCVENAAKIDELTIDEGLLD